MKVGLTIAQVARRLEVTERVARRLLEAAHAREVGRGAYNAMLYHPDDVDAVSLQIDTGAAARRSRHVILVDSLGLGDQETALRAAGLEVVAVDTLLEALSAHEIEGMPIVVMAPPAGELGLLRQVASELYLVIVTDDEAEVPTDIRRQCAVVDTDQFRRLIQLAWSLVGKRLEQVRLKL